MSYRINNRGSYVLDWRCRELGRVRRATGVHNAAMVRKLRTMMDNLYETGRIDVLRNIKNGVVTPLEVYEHWRTQTLRKVPSVATLKPISDIRSWIDTHEATDKTKQDYRNFVKRLTDVVGEDTVIASLPEALGKYREHCRGKNINRAFNLTRSVVQAYLNHNFGRHSEIWREASNVKPLPVSAKRDKRVLTVSEVASFYMCLKMMEKPDHANMFQTMVMLGTNWKEYTGEWRVLEDRIEIEGTKRACRVRVIPRFTKSYTRPVCSYRYFTTVLHEASKEYDKETGDTRPHLTTHALRATFSHLLEMAKIPRSRRLSYMGHSGGDTLGKYYEKHEADAYLVEDATRVRTYIKVTLAKDVDELIETFQRIREGRPHLKPESISDVWGLSEFDGSKHHP